MGKVTFKILILFLIIFYPYLTTNAQITIGAGEKPVSGALLQLKNIADVSDGGANATKGLIMPRVKLTNRHNLKDIVSDDGVDHSAYVGMAVYNVNRIENNENNRVCPGIHVWDGENWSPLTPYPVYPKLKDILYQKYPPKKVIDKRGAEEQEYWSAWFGTFVYKGGYDVSDYTPFSCDANQEVPTLGDGKYWFTQNLRTKLTPDGNAIPLMGTGDKSDLAVYCYPHNSNPLNSDIYDSQPYYGLMYSRKAALNGNNLHTDTGASNQSFNPRNNSMSYKDHDGNLKSQIVNGNMNPYDIPFQPYEVEVLFESALGRADGKIQGICPTGWHVPSQREWHEMLYLTTFSGQVYSSFYEGNVDEDNKKYNAWTLGAREVVARSNETGANQNVLRNYRSNHYDDNGYYALLTGWPDREGISVHDWGLTSYIWSSSLTDDQQYVWGHKIVGRSFYFQHNSNSVTTFRDTPSYCLPIRCVKDK